MALQKQNGVKKMLAGFTVNDPDVVLLGRETIYRNGIRVGWLSSGGFGYTVKQSIGYGYIRDPKGVNKDYIEAGDYELEVAAVRMPCKVHLKPLLKTSMKH
jgi:4-methylaminobutanoate oxidase (formaldehyde-forming)